MDADTVQQEILNLWYEISSTDFPTALRIDVARELRRVDAVADSDVKNHLGKWVALFDESLHFLLSMYAFAEENVNKVSKENTENAIAFRALIARMCALTVAVRRLIVAGLEDAAKSVVRSWVETLDLVIAVLADEEFARRFFFALKVDSYDANAFWKAEIGYGKLNRRLARILDRAGMTSEQQESFFEDRKIMKSFLSESVHSSLRSAMFSEVVPSLSQSGFYARSPLGYISAGSPNLLLRLVEEIHMFGTVFYKLLSNQNPPLLLDNSSFIADCSSLHAAFFTLQGAVERYSEESI